MSIKGIDAQIMITRTADFARESIAAQRKPEITQDYLSVQAKANEAQELRKVIKKSDAELQKLRPEDGGGSGAGGSGGGSGSHAESEEQNGELEPGTLVPLEKHMIDIKV